MAFNFQTFGTPAKEGPKKAGGFQFEGFGEDVPQQKKRGGLAKVAGFLAPSLTRTVEKAFDPGQDVSARDVIGSALEVASYAIPVGAGAKAASLAVKGAGLAGKAVVRKAAGGLAKRVLTYGAGGAASGGLAGAGRAVGEGKGSAEIAEGAVGGAALGGLAGAAIPVIGAGARAVRGGLASRAARQAEQKALVKSGAADSRVATKALSRGGRVITDEAASEAVRQGIPEADVALIKTAKQADLTKMNRMLDIRQSQLTNKRVVERATDVAGDTFIEKVAKPIQNLNREAGKKLDLVARRLAGNKVDASGAVSKLAEEFDRSGVRIVSGKKLSFSGSDFEGLKGVQGSLTNLWKRAMKIARSGDALQVHRTKSFIDNVVEYGAEGSGLSGKAERILKTFRHDIDDVLDKSFKQYNQVNTVFADTIRQLNDVGALLGRRFRVGDEFAGARAGVSLRRVMSNSQGRAEILKLIDGMQKVAQKYGIPIDEDVVTQTQFADILEKMLGSEAPTSFLGQGERFAGAAADVAKSGIVRGAVKAGKYVLDVTRGVNQENKIKALRALLSRGVRR